MGLWVNSMKELKSGLKVTSAMMLILTIITLCAWGLAELIQINEVLTCIIGTIILFLALSWGVGQTKIK